MSVMDTLNIKDGKGHAVFAGQGITQSWQMKRDVVAVLHDAPE